MQLDWQEVSARFTSPLKLFTYMASGIPIVASDIPSIREVLASDECFFFVPDDAESLANTIVLALNDSTSASRAEAAKIKCIEYTWDSRSRKIIDSIRTICPTTTV